MWRVCLRSAARGAALLLLPSVVIAQERAPAPSPTWRLGINALRAWGTGGATPEGRGFVTEVLGRRRLTLRSRVGVEFGLVVAGMDRRAGMREPDAPRPGPFADTSFAVSVVAPTLGLTADVARWRRATFSLDGAVTYGLVERRTRFGDAVTVVDRVGDRLGLSVGGTLRLDSGLSLRLRHLRVAGGDAALQGVAAGLGVTLF
mgnify:CR=1 FL=1